MDTEDANEVSDDKMLKIGEPDEELKPSPMRFLVALLQCLSSAMSSYILMTYAGAW